MKTIVITGSSRGIGYHLADQFLANQCQVVLSGRSVNSLSAAQINLVDKHPNTQLITVPCDVSEYDQIENLWLKAVEQFGKVDIWINNAGQAHSQAKSWEQPQSTMLNIVQSNVLGVMYGCKIAMQGMLRQGYGAIYNMEGLGSDGRIVEGLSIYGSSKSAVRYFSRCLVKDSAHTSIIVGTLSPGMVMTDLIRKQYAQDPVGWQKAKPIFNILADTPQTVAGWLAPHILNNKKNGAHIAWLPQWKALWRFISTPFIKRNVTD
ncbi:MAG: SDR family oxidoreductase [Anaerolineaceae bacterium]|nr:SDR family oxidoreductase [Anaerolineaceae bacterium]